MGFYKGCLEAAGVGKFRVRAHHLPFHQKNVPPWDRRARGGVEIKASPRWQNISALPELGSLLLPRSLLLFQPPETAGTSFCKGTFSFPHHVLMVLWCWPGGARAGPALNLTCGLPRCLALVPISGSCSQREDATNQCDLLWRHVVKPFL